jgi:hypothetical protein
MVDLMLAAETVENMGGETSHFVEWMVILSTVALALITGALTWVTYLVHKDSVQTLSHDNDNMHDVAVREIEARHEAHMERVRELKRIQHARKVR